ncbi:conserved hypothetical protein [Candida tropicalis MYA-3404]|uniref:Uncharacterized protein n=1 Tax=Candida tropicalis (strain ATCC MYA-3404 / T1) TaxID=294747 RepID=C5M6W2_CANTT|nr:conserved hypothetical protein [Candida tropicalis MYA-3404]EER34732.1 conserved hypothetical protein [Candida tropicalis MYA-3404]KAG4408609.1 hypothetical protein JTP64_001915 [Candida tropicalis]
MINDNIYKNIHDMASTTGNNNDGGVHAATSHNLSTTKATVDTDLSNISQFIFLEAGRNHKNGGKSDFSYESSLDIMTVQNNEDLKDDFSEFINIPSLVSDDEDIESSVMNKESSHGWKKQRSLQPTPTTIPSNLSERGTSSAQQQQQQQQSNEAQSQSAQLHHPTPVVHQDVQKVKRTAKARSQPTLTIEDVTKSVKQSSTTLATASSSKELSPAERKLEQTQIMTIIVKYVTAKIQNSFPPESPRNQKPNELPLDKFLLLLTSRLRLTLPVFLKAVIYLFRYMDIIYLLRYLNQTNNFVNYNDMGFELKKLIIGCFKLAIIKENRVLKNKYVLNWESITGMKNQEINTIVKSIVDRMNGKLNIKNIEVIRMKEEMYRFVKMVSIEV